MCAYDGSTVLAHMNRRSKGGEGDAARMKETEKSTRTHAHGVFIEVSKNIHNCTHAHTLSLQYNRGGMSGSINDSSK